MKNIITEPAEGILTIKVSRPNALNALNQATLDELQHLLQECYQNREIRGLILTGDGEKAFVAGADIRELASLNQLEASKFARKGQKLFKMIEDCPKPVVAAVNGFALGGGCELAMACHLRVATESARFGQPEVNLGTIPGYGGTQRLAQLVGKGRALELLMTGDIITAAEAKSLGLVNHVAATQQEMMELAHKILRKILGKAPVAIANVIRSVNEGFSFAAAGYEAEADLFGACSATADFREGTAAFLDKRQPAFTGN